MVKFGADISSHQTSYQKIINDNEFVIVKVTQGVNYTNPLSTAQSALAEKLKKKVGYYHFMEAGVDAIAQAKYFLEQVGSDAKKDGYLLVLDYEADGESTTGKSFTGNEPKVFMDYVYKQTGKRMVLYTMGSWAGGAGRFNWSDINKDYGLWLAAYPYGDSRAWQRAQTDWAIAQYGGYWGKNVFMHQYTSSPYDRNVLLGDWNKYANKVVTKTTTATKTATKRAVSVPKSDVDKFRSFGVVKWNRKNFKANLVEKKNGIWQAISYELAANGKKSYTWLNNGVPLSVVTRTNNKDQSHFNSGDTFRFEKDEMPIVAYDNASNGIKVRPAGNGSLDFWVDATVAWKA